MTTDIVVSFPVVFTTDLLPAWVKRPLHGHCPDVREEGVRKRRERARPSRTHAFRWWREVLSASGYETHGSRGKADKKIYQLQEVYTILERNAHFIASFSLEID